MTDNNNLDDIEEDFSDFDNEEFESGDEDFSEGDEFVEEEWDSFDQDGDMMVEEHGGKKKSSMMFNLIIALVALGGAGFVGMKFMGGSAPQQQIPQQTAQNNTIAPSMPDANGQMPMPVGDNAATASASPSSPSAAPVKTATTDFTPPPSDPELDFDMPMPFSNQAPEDAAAPEKAGAQSGAMLSDHADSMASPADDAVTAKAPAGFDSEPLTPLPADDMADSTNQNANDYALTGDSGSVASRSARAKPAMSAGNDGEVIAAVEGKIDQLFNRLDDIEARLKKSGAGYDDSALKASIAKLEKKVNALSGKISSGASVSSRSASSPAVTSRARTASVRVEEKPVAKEKVWILTSAQPGKATIKKIGQEDVISIAVGDHVSGLGEIRSISLVDGKWVVSATDGKITQ